MLGIVFGCGELLARILVQQEVDPDRIAVQIAMRRVGANGGKLDLADPAYRSIPAQVLVGALMNVAEGKSTASQKALDSGWSPVDLASGAITALDALNRTHPDARIPAYLRDLSFDRSREFEIRRSAAQFVSRRPEANLPEFYLRILTEYPELATVVVGALRVAAARPSAVLPMSTLYTPEVRAALLAHIERAGAKPGSTAELKAEYLEFVRAFDEAAGYARESQGAEPGPSGSKTSSPPPVAIQDNSKPNLPPSPPSKPSQPEPNRGPWRLTGVLVLGAMTLLAVVATWLKLKR